MFLFVGSKDLGMSLSKQGLLKLEFNCSWHSDWCAKSGFAV